MNNTIQYDILHPERTKLKSELRKLGINFYFSEDMKSLERKLAYARTHQPTFMQKILKRGDKIKC